MLCHPVLLKLTCYLITRRTNRLWQSFLHSTVYVKWDVYGWPNVAKFNNLHIYIQQLLFMFNKIYSYSTFYIYIQQCAFSFNFNLNYFRSTTIFVQLQLKLFSFNNNICSTSTKIIFIQQQYLFNFNCHIYLTLNKNNCSTSIQTSSFYFPLYLSYK